MKRIGLAAALCAAAFAQARPIVIQETSIIQTPDPTFYFGGRVAIDGDDAVVYGSKTIPDPNGLVDDSLTRAFLNRLRGYVNGVQKCEVVQDQWNAGQVGLVTYAAAADYDDISAVRP